MKGDYCKPLLWITALVFGPAALSGQEDRASDGQSQDPNLPRFDDILVRQIEAIEGQTLILPCTVKNLRDKVVSWIRSKDLHILTSGRHTFSSDFRFESVHSDSSGDFWGLRLRGARISDTGQYECQVNTDPKMSLAIGLTVTVVGVPSSAAASSMWVGQCLIKGPTEVRRPAGSSLILTCEVTPLISVYGREGVVFGGKPRVRWLHDGREIDPQLSSNSYKGVSIETRYDPTEDDRVFSKLRIEVVGWEDSGQYTCMQPSSKPDTVRLLVAEVETSEAMQRDFPIVPDSCTKGASSTFCIILCLISYFLLLRRLS